VAVSSSWGRAGQTENSAEPVARANADSCHASCYRRLRASHRRGSPITLGEMKYLVFIALSIIVTLCGRAASPEEVRLTMVRVQSAADIEGTYTRTVEGVEVYTFRGEMCMVTYHPKENSTGNVIALGATGASKWSVGKNGTAAVSASSVLSREVFFALVRWKDGEGLIRLDSMDSQPPECVSPEILNLLVYKREKKPNQSLEPTPIAVTHPASAGCAPAIVVAHL
jgi:hypothetical protein